MTLTPYIMYNGNCEEALNFYASAMGGEVLDLMRFEGSPMEDMKGVEGNKVMHARFKAGEVHFMASDGYGGGDISGANAMVHLSFDFDSPEQQEKVFNALSEGGKIEMPLQDTFWGARFGMLTDRYGIKWMFNYDKPGAHQ